MCSRVSILTTPYLNQSRAILQHIHLRGFIVGYMYIILAAAFLMADVSFTLYLQFTELNKIVFLTESATEMTTQVPVVNTSVPVSLHHLLLPIFLNNCIYLFVDTTLSELH